MTTSPDRYVARTKAEASLEATPNPSFVLLKALTPKASAWLISVISDDAQWVDGSVAIEHRYFPDIADAAFEAGFLFNARDTEQ